MAIPKYYEMHVPFLIFLNDGQAHALREIKDRMRQYFHLTDLDMAEMLPSNRQTVFDNRIGWARTYLKKAGLIDSPARGSFILTQAGRTVLADNPQVIDTDYLMQFRSFREFVTGVVDSSDVPTATEEGKNETPDDLFEESFKQINQGLQETLLDEVMKLTPSAFEHMVLDLLAKMGYGTFKNAAQPTAASGDEGINGIIMEDKLGFDLIYVQAKKWSGSHKIDRNVIQAFVGTIAGKGGKGLFVTTSEFSDQAKEYAANQHIILMDGKKLTNYMIEYNFGVMVNKVFEIKALDTDTFNRYLEE